MPLVLPVEQFFERLRAENPLLLDVRSPSEFRQAHIPGAVSFPLLNDEERKDVGITYKQRGKEAAVIKGYELVGGKFGKYVKQAMEMLAKHTSTSQAGKIYLYCWRGGMRSNIMAWVLRMAGIEVILLKYGYKAYRHYMLDMLDAERKILLLGGKTGSGKTEMMEKLRKAGEQVICLETLANHRGSAFGAMGMQPQPRNEHFENMLAEKWMQMDPDKTLWMENESQSIGSIVLQKKLFERMRNAPVVEIEMSKEERCKRIVAEYGKFPVEELIANTKKIEQRLGGQRTAEAIEALQNGDKMKWAEIALSYYDKTYEYGIETRSKGSVIKVEIKDDEAAEVQVQKLKQGAEKILNEMTMKV
jgi:tRNA 2-selenouridine synthase